MKKYDIGETMAIVPSRRFLVDLWEEENPELVQGVYLKQMMFDNGDRILDTELSLEGAFDETGFVRVSYSCKLAKFSEDEVFAVIVTDRNIWR